MSAASASPLPPPRAAARPSVRLSGVLALIVIAGLAVAAELYGSRNFVSLLAQAVIVSLLALGVGLLIRISGLVSFGHAAPFGLGAYGAALALAPASPLAPEVGLLLVVPAIAAVFFLVGLVVSRLEGIAFGMMTLALGQAAYVAASKFRKITGGADGLIVDLPRRLFGVSSTPLQEPGGMFAVALVVLALVCAGLWLFERSRRGKLAVAIRENEERVRFLGYRTRVLKAGVFALSAAVAAVGGVLYALYQGFVSPEILHWSFSGSALIMAILGGTVALWGPIAGAFAFFFLREELSGLTAHWLAVLGFTLIAVTVAWPTGLSGAARALARRLGGGTRRAAP